MPSYLVHDVDAIGTVADVLIDQREYLQLFRVDPTAPSTANPPALAHSDHDVLVVNSRATIYHRRCPCQLRCSGCGWVL